MSSESRPVSGVREASTDDAVLAEMVSRLVAALAPERIYLFGSRARGDAGEDSDYDIMVIVKERTGPGYHTEHVAHHALWGLGIAKDVVVVTRAQFDRQRGVIASLPATVQREGRLLYAA